jgi:hypothetical protein
MKRHVLFAICLFIGCQNLQASDELQPTAADSCALFPFMLEIFQKGGLGKDPGQYETAAWITKNPDGKLGLVFWPITPLRNRQYWKGKIPVNMIALVHVHTVAVPAQPSLKDKEAAAHIKAPIYSLHVKGVFRVMPSGEITQEAGPFWFNDVHALVCAQLLGR